MGIMFDNNVPEQGYSTIGLKPGILTRLHKSTEEYYPGMFLPSALIMIMNEIKQGFYSVDTHKVKIDFSGKYTSLTIRSDVKQWLKENYQNSRDDYERKYKVASFTQFGGIFMLNMFESKFYAQNYRIRLKEADFRWLVEEYEKRRQEYKTKYNVQTFEQFADVFLKDLFERMNAAKKILTF